MGGQESKDTSSSFQFSRIPDNYSSLEEVTAALANAGLESSNLIVGIDFTKSNEWTGSLSFQKKSLHYIGNFPNPYEQAISIIGRTLSTFDEDNLIPCFGFGDASTHDKDVFSFYPGGLYCRGFEDVLHQYRKIAPHVQLSGPTSFAPIIEMAIDVVEQSGGQYHILLIIADGQVTRSVETRRDHLSPQEQDTVNAIIKASEYPLSIVLVGVGDGPWDLMKKFDDNIPARAFDNFQFVNFTEIMCNDMPLSKKEAKFALSALMEIPSQYKATMKLNILGRCNGKGAKRMSLPPPVLEHAGSPFEPNKGLYFTTGASAPPIPDLVLHSTGCYPSKLPCGEERSIIDSASDDQVCPICLLNPKGMAFDCGHRTCCDCGKSLEICPICRSPVTMRIKLY